MVRLRRRSPVAGGGGGPFEEPRVRGFEDLAEVGRGWYSAEHLIRIAVQQTALVERRSYTGSEGAGLQTVGVPIRLPVQLRLEIRLRSPLRYLLRPCRRTATDTVQDQASVKQANSSTNEAAAASGTAAARPKKYRNGLQRRTSSRSCTGRRIGTPTACNPTQSDSVQLAGLAGAVTECCNRVRSVAQRSG